MTTTSPTAASSVPPTPSSWLTTALPLPTRERLVHLLPLRDVVVLLSCCRALRHDRELSALALRANELTSHFGFGCTFDWTAATPAYMVAAPTQQSACELGHDGSATLPLPADDDGVKLLSLAGLVCHQLDNILIHTEVVDSVLHSVLPFVDLDGSSAVTTQPDAEVDHDVPLAKQLDHVHLDTHTVSTGITPFGLHFKNIEIPSDTPWSSDCHFCSMVEKRVEAYTLDGFSYLFHREAQIIAVGDELRVAGCGDDSAEWAAAWENFTRLDALYDADLIASENAPDIMEKLIDYGELEMLPGMEKITEDGDDGDVACNAVCTAAHADLTNRVCRRLIVPLKQFFVTSGFRTIRHETIENAYFGLVDKVYGVAPCGFVMGVMVVSGTGLCFARYDE